MTLLAQDIIALTTSPGGTIGAASTDEALYAGAMLADLILGGAAKMPDSSEKKPHIELTDRQPEEPMLAEAASRLREAQQKTAKPLTAKKAVQAIAKDLYTPLMEDLEGRGVVKGEQKKFLFIPIGRKWVRNESTDADDLRVSICRQLRSGGPIQGTPHVDDRSAAVLGLLHAGRAIKSAVEHGADDRRDLIKKATAVVKGESEVEDSSRRAVKKAIDAARARINEINGGVSAATTAVIST